MTTLPSICLPKLLEECWTKCSYINIKNSMEGMEAPVTEILEKIDISVVIQSYWCPTPTLRLPRWLGYKESTCQARYMGSIPGWGGSPGGGIPLKWEQPTSVSVCAYRMPRTEARGGLQSMWWQRDLTYQVSKHAPLIRAIFLIIKNKMESRSNKTWLKLAICMKKGSVKINGHKFN